MGAIGQKNGSKREGEGEGDRGKESWEIIVSFPSTLKLARASSPTFFFLSKIHLGQSNLLGQGPVAPYCSRIYHIEFRDESRESVILY